MFVVAVGFCFFKSWVAENTRHPTRPPCQEEQLPKCLRARGNYAATVASKGAMRATSVLKV